MNKISILLKFYPENPFHHLPAQGGQHRSLYHPSCPRFNPGGHHRSTNHLFPTPGEFALFHRKFQRPYPTHHHPPIIRPKELQPTPQIIQTICFFHLLMCFCYHRAQESEYKTLHRRRRRASARPVTTPPHHTLHPRRPRTSPTTPTTRTLDSTLQYPFRATRASQHRTIGLTSHRADSK
jgi:hypothetical protein